MKQFLLILLFFFGCIYCKAQPLYTANKNNEEVLTPEKLSHSLTQNLKTEREKVTSIFNWITDNISYRVKSWTNRFPVLKEEPFDFAAFMRKPNDEIIAERVIITGSAYCDGYSRLFKTLCDYAGIKSEIIVGFARNTPGRKFSSNHKWNAVMIDSSWYLLDATWASGYVTSSNEFVKRYDGNYFLAPPASFISDHYPEDVKWTLLKDTPTVRDFSYSPFRYMAFFYSKVNSYFPSKGVIEAAVGDTIKFDMEVIDSKNRLYISSTPEIDSSLLEEKLIGSPFDKTTSTFLQKVSCKYIVECKDVNWLYIIYNNEVILKYRLKISETISPANHLSSTAQIH